MSKQTSPEGAKKSYWLKSEKGNIASVTFTGKKKPSKKMIAALSNLIDRAAEQVKK